MQIAKMQILIDDSITHYIPGYAKCLKTQDKKGKIEKITTLCRKKLYIVWFFYQTNDVTSGVTTVAK